MKKITLLVVLLLTVSFGYSQAGTWKIKPAAGAMGVGPSQGSTGWWANNAADVTTRACLFDDQYVLSSDGTFENVQGSDTWLESWQGGTDACATPVAPHDGSNAATWAFNYNAGTLTITGTGAYLGIPKAVNAGELSNGVSVPTSITYLVTAISATEMTLDIETGSGVWWRFIMEKEAAAGTDATLSDLQVDAATITDFLSSTTSYTYDVPIGTSTIPTVTATTTDANATTVITQATTIPGDATVVVTAQDGTAQNTYTVSFVEAVVLTTAPTAPTADAADVIAVYSEAYTTNIATNLNPNWGQATAVTEETIAGNNVLKYKNLNYQGLEYTSADVSGYEYVHLDYWTADATALQFFLIAAGENAYDIAATDGITTGQWVSLDIPLSFYSDAGRDLTTAIQFKTVGDGTVYFDNIYFWKAPTASGSDATLSDLALDGTTISGFSANSENYSVDLVEGTTTVPQITAATTTDGNATSVITQATAIPGSATVVVTAQDGTTQKTYTVSFAITTPNSAPTAPTADAADVVAIYSEAYTTNIATNTNPGWGQATVVTEETIAGNNVLKYAGLNYQGTDYTQTDVSGHEYFHLDYWTANSTALDIYVLNAGGTEVVKTLTVVTGSWQSVDIPLTDFAGVDLTGANQLKIEGNGDVFFDNIYFWKAPTASGSDATLSDLALDGTTIDSFSNNTTSYTYATNSIPTVTATTTDANATAVITQATTIPGDATVVVTAQDGTTTKTYTVSFVDPPITSLNVNFDGASGFVGADGASFSETGGIGTASGVNNGDWAHIYLDIPGGIDLSAGDRGFSIKVRGDREIPLKWKLQEGTSHWINHEVDGGVLYSGSGNWETITFDFSAHTSTNMTRLVVFFDIQGAPTSSKGVSGKTAAVDAFDIDDLVFGKFISLSVEELEQFNFSIYPNPANDFVQLKAAKTIDFVEVYDIMGRSVLRNMPNAKEKTLNVSSLSEGIYIVKIGIDGAVGTSKLLKQ